MKILIYFVIGSVVFSLCQVEYVNTEDVQSRSIGLIYEQDDIDTVLAYTYNPHLGPLLPERECVSSESSFETLEAVCNLVSKGVIGILDSTSKASSNVVQSVCDALDIPHITTRWNDIGTRNSIINLHPHPRVLGQVYIDLVLAFGWKKFTVFYENNDGLSRIGDLVKMNDGTGSYNVVVRRLYRDDTGGYRRVFKEAWKSGHSNFVLDCETDSLEIIFKHAQQVGLMRSDYNFIVTCLDMHTIDLEPFQFSETNITGIRIVNPQNPIVRNFSRHIEEKKIEFCEEYFKCDNETAPEKLRLKVALMADAVALYSKAIQGFPLLTTTLDCKIAKTWGSGSSLVNLIRESKVDGLTGSVALNSEGFRTDISLEVIELQERGLVLVGEWNYRQGLTFSRSYLIDEISNASLRNASLKVMITMTDPYGMLKRTHEHLEGNERYEGFGIDLIQELSILLGFNYTFIVRDDKMNGVKSDVTGKWSGLIGDVIEGVTDLAITDLTITSQREKDVDFSVPFMNLGISILYKKPKKAPPNFFSFAEPFAIEVWLCLGLAYFTVSMSLFIMGRLCNSEWTNPYPCIEEPEFLINQFSLRNAFWFTIGSLMQQGTEIAPIAYATRMVAGCWWFFTLIMVSSYTANLAAFLTTEKPDIPFSSLNELIERAEKYGIQFGARKEGATEEFFKVARNEVYNYFLEHPEVRVRDNTDGVQKALDENYAFFMESVSIEYEVQRKCTLQQVNGLLDEKGYGIAMRNNSLYRNELNTALLQLQASGKIQDLKRRWWEEKHGGGQCAGDDETQEAKALNLKNVGGVFGVVVGGVGTAMVLVFLEMVLYVMKQSVKHKRSFRRDLKAELKFYFKFKGLVKSTTRSEDKANSLAGSTEGLRNTPAPLVLPDLTQDKSC